MAEKIIRPDFASVKTEYKELGSYLSDYRGRKEAPRNRGIKNILIM